MQTLIGVDINIFDVSASALGLSSLSLGTLLSARSAISPIDLAIDSVSGIRADLGIQQNRLGHTVARNNVAVENMQASESTIRDADVAEEVTAFTRDQITVQSGTALLAQANAIPQNALTLLQ